MKKIFWEGLAVCTFLCTVAAYPSEAGICLLSTGQCEQGVQADSANCTPGVDGMTAAEKDKLISDGGSWSCWPNSSCPDLFKCVQSDCRNRGYTSGTTNSESKYPYGFNERDHECLPCFQGGYVYWQCHDRPCNDGYFKSGDAQCAENEFWMDKSTDDKTIVTGCGQCETVVCPEEKGEMTEEQARMVPGCINVIYKETVRKGSHEVKCYITEEMDKDIITLAEKSLLSDTCYKFTEVPSGNGTTCYTKEELTCEADEWKNVHEEDGIEICECVPNGRKFEFTDGIKQRNDYYDSKILTFTAAGKVKDSSGNVLNTNRHIVEVVSQLISEDTSDLPFTTPASILGCSVSKADNLVYVDCPNPSNTTENPREASFTLKQTYNNDTWTLDVKVIIEPDSCPQGALNVQCAANEAKQELQEKSIAGQACYECASDVCAEGFFKSETPLDPKDGYEIGEPTPAGSVCYKVKQCPEGYSTDYPNLESCTKNGHPEGWSHDLNGMSDGKPCGKCKPNKCTGMNRDVQCQDTPFCNEADANCGYKDEIEEYEGDTPKYDANIKACPRGSTQIKSVEDCTKNGHPEGWNLVQVGVSGEEICNDCEPKQCTGMNREVQCQATPFCDENDINCGFKDAIDEYEGDTPKYDANIKRCPDGFSTEITSCGAGYNMVNNGISADKPCNKCEPKACPDGFSTEVTSCGEGYDMVTNGISGNLNCNKCEPKTCPEGYSTDATTCGEGYDRVVNGKAGDAECAKCEPKTCPEGYSTDVTCGTGYNKVTSGMSGEEECAKCEYVPTCHATEKGLFGEGCCADADCSNGDEFPLYCFNAPSEDGTSTKSCRECGAFSDGDLFDKSIKRFEDKCAIRGGCKKLTGTADGGPAYEYVSSDEPSRIMTIWLTVKDGTRLDRHFHKYGDQYEWYGYDSKHRVACRNGEYVTYDNTYNNTDKNPELVADVYGKDDTICPAGSSKKYPSGCKAEDAIVVGKTEFGSFCWACPEK